MYVFRVTLTRGGCQTSHLLMAICDIVVNHCLTVLMPSIRSMVYALYCLSSNDWSVLEH